MVRPQPPHSGQPSKNRRASLRADSITCYAPLLTNIIITPTRHNNFHCRQGVLSTQFLTGHYATNPYLCHFGSCSDSSWSSSNAIVLQSIGMQQGQGFEVHISEAGRVLDNAKKKRKKSLMRCIVSILYPCYNTHTFVIGESSMSLFSAHDQEIWLSTDCLGLPGNTTPNPKRLVYQYECE